MYASQKNNQIGRKRLKASKLRLLQLGSTPDINEPLRPKPKWTRRRTYQRIRNEIQILEAKAKTRRFNNPPATGCSPKRISRTSDSRANKSGIAVLLVELQVRLRSDVLAW